MAQLPTKIKGRDCEGNGVGTGRAGFKGPGLAAVMSQIANQMGGNVGGGEAGERERERESVY